MRTQTLITGQWMPSRLRFPLLLLLPLLLLWPSLAGGKLFLPQAPITQEPLARQYPTEASAALQDTNRVATDRIFPVLTDELEIQRQLFQGHLPTWDEKRGLGGPLAASSMAAPWSPLRWPFLFMDPAGASVWHALLSLAVAGLGMMMFLEGRGMKFTAAFFAAVCFQGSGFMVANLHYIMKVDALVWAPWCLWGVDLIYRGRKNAGLILALSLGCSGLAGFPPVFVFVAFMTLAWIAVRAMEAMRTNGELGNWSRSFKSALIFGFLGCCLGAVHLVPMGEAAQFSARGPQTAELVQAQSLPTGTLISTLLPTAFGSPTDTYPAQEEAGSWYWTDPQVVAEGAGANRLEWHLFAGLTALCLALAALFSKPRQSLFPLGLLLCAWGYMFDWTGFSFLYGLPGANLGSPARAAGLAALAIGWLAAIGFNELLSGQRSARVGTLLGGIMGAGLGIWIWTGLEPSTWGAEVAKGLPLQLNPQLEAIAQALKQTGQVSGQRIQGSAETLIAVSLGVAVLAKFAGRLTVRGVGLFGCLLMVVEGTLAGSPHTTPSELGELSTFPSSESINVLRDVAGSGRVLRVDNSPSGVGEVIRLARPNMLSAYGVRDLTPYQSLPSASLRQVWGAFDPDGLYRTGVSRLSSTSLLDRPILDAMGVTCILSTRSLEHERLELRHSQEQFYVYARSGSLGPARIVPRIVAGAPEDLQRLTSQEHDFSQFAFAAYEDSPLVIGAEFLVGKVNVTRSAPHRIDVATNDSSGGYLVIHEGWMPDWKATIDGEDAPVLRLDHLFFGVQLPEGDHVIRFKYEPWSLRLGTLISLGALLCTLLLTRGRHYRVRAMNDALLPHAPTDPR